MILDKAKDYLLMSLGFKKDPIELQDAYRKTFDTVDGQMVLAHLIKTFHMFRPTFSGDPHLTSFKEGQRHVVSSILNFIEKDIDELQKTMNENNGL